MYCVKPLRLASFRAVLEDLGDAIPHACSIDDDSPGSPPGEAARFTQFGSLLDAMPPGMAVFVSPVHMSLYYAEVGAGAASEMPRSMSDTDMVSEELHLRRRLSAQDLRHLRREFARGNHPDSVPAPMREQATRRMGLANSLIDQALKALSLPLSVRP